MTRRGRLFTIQASSRDPQNPRVAEKVPGSRQLALQSRRVPASPCNQPTSAPTPAMARHRGGLAARRTHASAQTNKFHGCKQRMTKASRTRAEVTPSPSAAAFWACKPASQPEGPPLQRGPTPPGGPPAPRSPPASRRPVQPGAAAGTRNRGLRGRALLGCRRASAFCVFPADPRSREGGGGFPASPRSPRLLPISRLPVGPTGDEAEAARAAGGGSRGSGATHRGGVLECRAQGKDFGEGAGGRRGCRGTSRGP
jgi:hypothetical protein